jgi:hypothetical protein
LGFGGWILLLPKFTQFVLGASEFVAHNILSVVALIIMLKLALRTKPGRKIWDRVVLSSACWADREQSGRRAIRTHAGDAAQFGRSSLQALTIVIRQKITSAELKTLL